VEENKSSSQSKPELKLTKIEELLMKKDYYELPEFLARYIILKFGVRYFMLDTKTSLGFFIPNKEKGYWQEISEDYLETLIGKTYNVLLKKGYIELKKEDVRPAITISKVKQVKYYIKSLTGKIITPSNFISFNNAYLDWEELLKGNFDNAAWLKRYKEIPYVFNHIDYDLDVSTLHYILPNNSLLDVEKEKQLIEKELPNTVNIFKQWVNDNWLLLFEIIGYCLIPSYPLHKAFMLYGDGSNGKSTYLALLRKILGPQNVSGIPLHSLIDNRFAPANLRNKLANIFPDIPSITLKNTGIFKALTGEDKIDVDRKFKDFIPLHNYAKLIFSTNRLPITKDLSPAFFDRWILVEFPNKFPRVISNEEFIEKNFPKEEIEKIIVYSILAVYLVLKRGKFSITGMDLKEAWLRLSNSVYAFIKDMLKEGILLENAAGKIKANELYNMYLSYCEENDLEAFNRRKFYEQLQDLGYSKYRSGGETYVKGLVKKEEYTVSFA
jgi:P4 family phage/plasmid primase-like protien